MFLKQAPRKKIHKERTIPSYEKEPSAQQKEHGTHKFDTNVLGDDNKT